MDDTLKNLKWFGGAMEKAKEIKSKVIRVIMDNPPVGEMPTRKQIFKFLKDLLGDDYDPTQDKDYQEGDLDPEEEKPS